MATSTLGSGTLVLAGTTSGTTTVTATAVAGTTTLTLPAATDTLVGKATTDTLTNKTLTGAAMNGTLGATTPSTVAATTLTTSSTVTHNGGTANGVAYLNGSKVLTTGSALVFDGTNLGIGNTSPLSRLDVAVEATLTRRFLVNFDDSVITVKGASNTADPEALRFIGDNIRFNTGTSGSGTEAARFSSGNLLVGDTTAAAGTARVYIKGDATNPAFRALANTTTTSIYAGVFRHESTTAGAYIQFVTDSNAETGRIYDAAGAMQYASTSDARLKTNVQPMQNGLQSVLALNPCTFDMRRGEDTFISSSGLIAQEVHEVYPFVVGIGGDNENTNPWSVDYGKLTPLLVAAIKDQQALITQLQADVAALKGA